MQRTITPALMLIGLLAACDPSGAKDEPPAETKGASNAEPKKELEPTPTPNPAAPAGEAMAATPAPPPTPSPAPAAEPQVPKMRVNSLGKAGIDGLGVFADWAAIEKKWGSAIPTMAPAEEVEATGCTEIGWKFPTKGIELFGCGQGAEKTVYAMALLGTSRLATTAGVKIGDDLTAIKAAYSQYGGPQHQGTAKADGLGWEWVEQPDTLNIYDYEARMSLQFTMKDGKVSRIDLSSMGE